MGAGRAPGQQQNGLVDPCAGRPWLARYPAGVPAEIDPGPVGTLVDVFDASLRRYPERAALESFGVRMSYAELGRAAAAVASWLQSAGIGEGDRIAIMLPNVMAYPAILFGALMAGATVVNVNPLYTPRELAFQLRDCGARAIFVLENFAATVEACAQELPIERVVVVAPGDLLGPKGLLINFVSRHLRKAVPAYDLPGATSFATVLRRGRAMPPRTVPVAPQDVAFLQYTGGTTGVAKGAALTHRNVVANLLQVEAWLRPVLRDDLHTMVTALPLYHVYALTCCCMTMIQRGGCQVLIANPRDIPGFVKTLRTRPFTCLSGVNTLYAALARAPGIEEVDFSKVVLCSAGGMATHSAVAEAWMKLTGRPIVEGYGLSETSPVVTTNLTDIPAFTGTIGYPLSSTEISIRSADGTVAAAGERGELCIRGPQVMAGYWQRPDETAKAMTADGFFRTGDVAVLEPDGAVRIVDRMKDMILVSGFNVYPNEVEDVIASHPGVAEVAVIGRPSGKTGELVAAYVVLGDLALTPAEIHAWCEERLAPYKLPREILFRESLPKTNVGKVLRRSLREEEDGHRAAA